MKLQELVKEDEIKQRFSDMLGKRANQFISSLISAANQSTMLKQADPMTIISAGAMAASLDLPINPSLGYAYIVPYKCKEGNNYVTKATFQIGYKGFIQLGQRSGQFKTINVTDIKEGEIKSEDRLTGAIEFEWSAEKRSEKNTIGFVAYFELLNGFSKMLYMSVEDLKGHGLKYSQSYKNERTRGKSLWETDFDTMCSKTVIKLLLSRYAPLSIEMQRAIIADHSVVNDTETLDVDYVDQQTPSIAEIDDGKEHDRVQEFIKNAKDSEQLKQVKESASQHGLFDEYESKEKELTK